MTSMQKFKGLMTSLRSDWRTPRDLYDQLDREFHFKLDPCAAPAHQLAPRNYCVGGLSCDWVGPVFMNPPYGREIGKWVEKAHQESIFGITVVCLLPSRTDTDWWHKHVMEADEIRFIRGRLKFSGHKNSAPFPSAVVVFRRRKQP